MSIVWTVPVPAEAHAICSPSALDSKQSICSNCKKPKDKTTKRTASTIIQSGNHTYIVDANGRAHKIIGSLSSTSTMATNSMHFLQKDDLDSIDPLVLESMCSADMDKYAHFTEYSWLTAQECLHVSVDWHKRRRNIEDLDLVAVMAAPLPTSSS